MLYQTLSLSSAHISEILKVLKKLQKIFCLFYASLGKILVGISKLQK